MNVQEATAKALLVDTGALARAQQAGDVLGANAVLMDAFSTDVRPLLAEVRADMGLDPDPVAAYHRSGYAEKIAAERVGETDRQVRAGPDVMQRAESLPVQPFGPAAQRRIMLLPGCDRVILIHA